MRNKANLLYEIASALISKLWIKGLISDDEKMKIDEKNILSFLSS